MDKESFKSQKEIELMKKSSAAQLTVAIYTGESLVVYLTSTMGVSRTMVAALLDVTERTLSNWSSQSTEVLSTSGSKSKRLVALYDFIYKAEKLGVPNAAMVSLLQEPISQDEQRGNTPMFFIIEDPDNSCLKSTSDLIIKNFLTLL